MDELMPLLAAGAGGPAVQELDAVYVVIDWAPDCTMPRVAAWGSYGQMCNDVRSRVAWSDRLALRVTGTLRTKCKIDFGSGRVLYIDRAAVPGGMWRAGAPTGGAGTGGTGQVPPARAGIT
jgi:hypothetical protein